jgi:hypothetical protein
VFYADVADSLDLIHVARTKGCISVWGPPHVRRLLYTCCKSDVFLSFFLFYFLSGSHKTLKTHAQSVNLLPRRLYFIGFRLSVFQSNSSLLVSHGNHETENKIPRIQTDPENRNPHSLYSPTTQANPISINLVFLFLFYPSLPQSQGRAPRVLTRSVPPVPQYHLR